MSDKDTMEVLSIRENPGLEKEAIAYFQESWPSIPKIIYEDAIHFSIGARNPLPQWYLLKSKNEIIGCAGLITNDFISRGDLYPWLNALFIEEQHRGNNYPSLLFEKAKTDCVKAGFKYLYLCTEHKNYYERHGFTYIGDGHHPWGESSRIYELRL